MLIVLLSFLLTSTISLAISPRELFVYEEGRYWITPENLVQLGQNMQEIKKQADRVPALEEKVAFYKIAIKEERKSGNQAIEVLLKVNEKITIEKDLWKDLAILREDKIDLLEDKIEAINNKQKFDKINSYKNGALIGAVVTLTIIMMN